MTERKYKALADAYDPLYDSGRAAYSEVELKAHAILSMKEKVLNSEDILLVKNWDNKEIETSDIMKIISDASDRFKIVTAGPHKRWEFMSKFEHGLLKNNPKEFSDEKARQEIEEKNKLRADMANGLQNAANILQNTAEKLLKEKQIDEEKVKLLGQRTIDLF
jgi:hypothetical protein